MVEGEDENRQMETTALRHSAFVRQKALLERSRYCAAIICAVSTCCKSEGTHSRRVPLVRYTSEK